jgi:hypothetical protein
MSKCKAIGCENEAKKIYCSSRCSALTNIRLYGADGACIGKIRADKNKKNFEKLGKRCAGCQNFLVYEKRRNKFCSHSCSASKTNVGINRKTQKISEIGLANIRKSNNKRKGISTPFPNRKYKSKAIKVTRICLYCNNEYETLSYKRKKYCSAACYSKCSGGFRMNSTRKLRSFYKGFQMDSGAERRFAELLDSSAIVWTKNSTKFFEYQDFAGKTRKYYPDFFLPEYNGWVEIKGKYYARPEDSLKIQAVINEGLYCELIDGEHLHIPKFIEVRDCLGGRLSVT